jgi:hypothetical protein
MSCRRTRSFFPIAAVAMALSAANDGSVLIANRDKIGSFETFLVVDAGSGKSALKCIGNNKYVCAEKAGGASLAANRSRVGGWESYTYSFSQATTTSTPTPSDNLIKQAKASFVTRDTQVSINASPSDIVCIIMGASSGPDGNNVEIHSVRAQ